jgi:hypothetical protein
LAVGGDHGCGGFAVSAGFFAGLGAGAFGVEGGDDAFLDFGDAVGEESGVYLLLDGPASLCRAAVVGGWTCG